MSEITVTIPEVSLSSDASFINYHVQIHSTQTGKSTLILKRYTDFELLRQELETFYSEKIPLEFPGKTYFWTSSTDEYLAEERRLVFERFLQGLLKSKDSKWRKTLIFREFLNLPPGTFTNTPTNSTQEKMKQVWDLTKTKEPITDLNQWISVVKETKNILNESKSMVGKSHSESKKKLVIGNSRIECLSLGLAQQKIRLTGHEMQRREDLLDSLKREVTIIQQLQSSSSSSSSVTDGSQTQMGMSRPDNGKSQLFKGRVLGAPQETSRTLNLDDQQLLQLQRNDFKKQDEELQQLGKVIARQKELGIAINEELKLQNELLDELDGEVDRTNSKLHYASKRAEKFT
ncbi:hypothetical protein WICPIJ_006078 [Wickerhamomyces pijperi]|uniref:Uncharacterized protein n=1 Tax=Wickerhamomyces pijperi TaxID=599730 RepID=A0A9P8Q2C0_WICPI|nr:hypothetical protein WICPIJ_006078 [Wickerhamomyces pijperi]